VFECDGEGVEKGSNEINIKGLTTLSRPCYRSFEQYEVISLGETNMSNFVGRARLGSVPEVRMFGADKDKPGMVVRLKIMEFQRDGKSGEFDDVGPWCDAILWRYAEDASALFNSGDPVMVEGNLYEKNGYLKMNVYEMCPLTPYLDTLAFKPKRGKATAETKTEAEFETDIAADIAADIEAEIETTNR
jgi:hypothetical protein